MLETELYADLNRTRQVRNSWMHSLEYVTDQEAVQAITTAYKMLLRTYNVDILVQLSRGMTY